MATSRSHTPTRAAMWSFDSETSSIRKMSLIVPLNSADRLADAIREAANDGRAARADLDQQQQPAQQPEEQQRLALPAPPSADLPYHGRECAMAKSPMAAIRLIVAAESAGRFTARLESTGEVIVTRTRQPLVDGARELLARGFDPATPLTMRHEGKGYDSFQPLPIGHWAKWTYKEREKDGMTVERWMPFAAPRSGQKSGSEPSVAPEGRETENRFHGGRGIQPSPSPGAAVASP